MSEREKNEKSTVRPMKRTRKKVCAFCADRAEFIDYKDVAKLRKCMKQLYKKSMLNRIDFFIFIY